MAQVLSYLKIDSAFYLTSTLTSSKAALKESLFKTFALFAYLNSGSR
jgi:hypothetical protein